MKCSLLVLSTYLDNELDAQKRGELEAHLVGCQRCRSGLGYLGEEVERISALASVHVPDHSVHSLFEQLGLLGCEDPLPYRATPDPVASVPGAPSWLRAPRPGKALPWDSGADRRGAQAPAAAPTGTVLPGPAEQPAPSDG